MDAVKLTQMICDAFEFEPESDGLKWNPSLTDEDLMDLLPEALVALLDAGNRSRAALVVDFLDAVRAGSPSSEREATDLVRKIKQDDFSDYGREECAAIVAWLRFVRDWPELRAVRASIEASIVDWDKRAAKSAY